MANITRREGGRELTRRGEWEPFRWDPLRMVRELLRDPFGEMASLVAPLEGPTFIPLFEVKESKDGYVFKADLPGVKESDLDISLTGHRLTVSGKREAEEREESATYYAYERAYGSFSRSFTLPEGVDPDGVSADLRDGVLTIRVAKRPELQAKKIELKGGPGGEKKVKA